MVRRSLLIWVCSTVNGGIEQRGRPVAVSESSSRTRSGGAFVGRTAPEPVSASPQQSTAGVFVAWLRHARLSAKGTSSVSVLDERRIMVLSNSALHLTSSTAPLAGERRVGRTVAGVTGANGHA